MTRRVSLTQYAATLEKSDKPSDRAVAKYIRSHEAMLLGCLHRFSKGLSKDDREELVQTALLAIVQAVTTGGDAEHALREVRNAMERASDHRFTWNTRRTAMPSPHDDNEEN